MIETNLRRWIGTASSIARERVVPLALLAIAMLVLLFFKIASEVIEGDTQAFDSEFLIWLRHATEGDGPIRNALRTAMLDITALGNPTILILISAVAVGYLVAARRRAMAMLLVATLGAGTIAELGLKALFSRTRPDVVAHLVEVSSASFPSGHAMDSTMIYMTIAALIARTARDMAPRIYVLLVALCLSLSIGFSRLYLGVHYPTDVLAGWIAGSAWAAGSSILAARLQRAHQVEPPSDGEA